MFFVKCLENIICYVFVYIIKDNNGIWYFINKVELFLIDIYCCLIFLFEDFIFNNFLY